MAANEWAKDTPGLELSVGAFAEAAAIVIGPHNSHDQLVAPRLWVPATGKDDQVRLKY
jgi:hypothetical protein